MIEVKVDENIIRELALEKIQEQLREVDQELVFWDANELKKRTCMSWGSIQTTFFFDPDFPKYKVGQKWYFPAKETKQFLLDWLKKQS